MAGSSSSRRALSRSSPSSRPEALPPQPAPAGALPRRPRSRGAFCLGVRALSAVRLSGPVSIAAVLIQRVKLGIERKERPEGRHLTMFMLRTAVTAALVLLSAQIAAADDWVAAKLRGRVLQLIDNQWQPLNRGDVVPDARVIRTLFN